MAPVPQNDSRSKRSRGGAGCCRILLASALTTLGSAQSADLADVIPRVMPSVVYLRVAAPARKPPVAPPSDPELQDFLRRFAPQPGQSGSRSTQQDGASAGTGMIVSPDGHILTADFVITPDSSVEVELDDRRVFDARVLGSDRARGVSLLKIEAAGLPSVRFSRRPLPRVGEQVFAVGAPYRMPRTVTDGIVSRIDTEAGAYIQTTASINPGSGGGPLFDLEGEVVGMNHSIYSRTGAFQGISFVVPAATVVRAYEDLRATGRATRGSIGIVIGDVDGRALGSRTPMLPPGVQVREVEAGSPAEKAGLRAGDVIIRADGHGLRSTTQLIALIRDSRIGSVLRLDLLRDGRVSFAEVEIARAPDR